MSQIICLLLSFILAMYAYIKKSMTNNAIILCIIFSLIIIWYGDLPAFVMLATVFLGTVIAGKIKSKKRKEITKDVNTKGHQKDVASIIANVAPGVISLIIYGLTKNSLFIVVYASLMAEAISDSLASDIGVLSSKEPINILTFKKSKPGLSGNISFLGLISSLIGSISIALIYYLFNPNIIHFLIITLSGFLGNLIDSLLGALLQVKYKCPQCNIITEKKEHCKTKTIIVKGSEIFNNDVVNLISNILSGLISFIILIII